MIFRIENIGPLREAEVDLSKRLLVLTGPNNTGKTYLAWSVYGLHRSSPRLAAPLFEHVAERLLTSPLHEADLGDVLGNRYQDLLSSTASQFAGEIHHCFAAERGRFGNVHVLLDDAGSADLIGHMKESRWRTISFDAPSAERYALLHKHDHSTSFTFGLSTGDDFGATVSALLDKEGAELLSQQTTDHLGSMTAEKRALLLLRLSDELAQLVRAALFPPCVIFPAERLAVNIFAKELALKRTELVDELVDADIEGKSQVPMDLVRRSAGRYPWPIRDSLRIANDLARLRKRESEFADIAAEIEAAVLGGKIDVSAEGEMSFAPREAPDKHLGVHLTASVVKSLSSLVFYFRHLARSGDFLVIDEPELNLHPDNQRKLARILAKVVNRGFKVMMSTHSDYIVRELNHMIMLSKLPPEEAKALGYEPACALSPGDVGVHLFDEHTARSLPVTETGFSVPTIDEQINSLNADAQRLFSRLLGGEPS